MKKGRITVFPVAPIETRARVGQTIFGLKAFYLPTPDGLREMARDLMDAAEELDRQTEDAMREEEIAQERLEQETRAYEAGLDKNGNFHG